MEAPVSLVHHDIESAFPCYFFDSLLLSHPPSDILPTLPIQLSDLGLARFIDPHTPLTRTRCGSEAYAAPELVPARRAYDHHDPRATNA